VLDGEGVGELVLVEPASGRVVARRILSHRSRRTG
jgi:hypothetical protein